MTSPKQATDLEFSIRRQSDITLAVAAIFRAGLLGAFPLDERSIVGTVVSELGTNILKYAGHGVVRVLCLELDGRHGVRVVAEDQGPGIGDLEAALKDGFSTGGTLGLGLPAVRRLTDTLNITSLPGGGTRVEAIRWSRRPPSAMPIPSKTALSPFASASLKPVAKAVSAGPLKVRIETRNRPYPRQVVSGDRAWSHETEGYVLLVHLDGTGHGAKADHATCCIVERIEQEIAKWPPQPSAEVILPLLDACHNAATGTVGAAITLAMIDRLSHILHYVGVGNTCMMYFSPGGWEGVPRPGVIGQQYRLPSVASLPLQSGDRVVTFSDGVSSSAIRQLRKRSDRPSGACAIAERLMAESKDSDDASCLVAEFFM